MKSVHDSGIEYEMGKEDRSEKDEEIIEEKSLNNGIDQNMAKMDSWV